MRGPPGPSLETYSAKASTCSIGSYPVARSFASDSVECSGRGAIARPAPYSAVVTDVTSSRARPRSANTSRAIPAHVIASPDCETLYVPKGAPPASRCTVAAAISSANASRPHWSSTTVGEPPSSARRAMVRTKLTPSPTTHDVRST